MSTIGDKIAAAIAAMSDYKSRTLASLGEKVPATYTVNGHSLSGNVTLVPSDLGLGNVNNTSDANKPVSTAQAAADTLVLNTAKTYAEGLVVGLWDDRGNYDASVNAFPTAGGSGTAGAVLKGDIWTISVAGTVGGVAVAIRQTVRAMVDTPGQTVGNWAIGLANADIDNSITQGITGRAPSQDAVYQALVTAANASNLSAGTLGAARLPAFSGDVTSAGGTAALTLATVNGNVGTFGGNNSIPTFTVNAKGLITAVNTVVPSGTWGISISGSAASAATAAALTAANNYQMNSIGVNVAPSGVAGEIRATGNISGYYSDRRMKTVIGNIENALDAVCLLNGVVYVANDIANSYGYLSKEEEVGVIAQEVQKVLPQIVTPAPFDIAVGEDGVEYSRTGLNYLTVRYDRLTPLLIEAIKELSGQVKALQAEVSALKAK